MPLRGGGSNAVVDFNEHTVSLVAVTTDVVRFGRPVIGIAFDSIGRYGQSGVLRERMIPRLLSAPPTSLQGEDGLLDPARVLAAAMRNEKPGGHGDRAHAAAVLELATWDALAKTADEPACVTIARRLATSGGAAPDVAVYAAGGYYREGSDVGDLRAEVQSYLDLGHTAVKIKIGGAPLDVDLRRVEEALDVVGSGDALCVDANGRFDAKAARTYASALEAYGLRWLEEFTDPLDFELTAALVAEGGSPIATGENLFSVGDVRNLLRYGALRPGRDVVQTDPGLSYGLTEYSKVLEVAANHNMDRTQLIPHGGHLINLHVVAGLRLGGCEHYPGRFAPFGGFDTDQLATPGRARVPDAPGFGLESMVGLQDEIKELVA